MNNEQIELDIAERLLVTGCSQNQIAAMEEMLSTLEHEFISIHLEIHAMRSIAHCGPESQETFERYADSVLRSSNDLLIALRRQRDSVAGLIGRRKR